ncbi:methylmalonate-semialdehyde dehydrogenase, partial [Pseudomonas aeruginosa]|nr:methylmalonate-semialdehyde dehydrogenase [Pseudomonas aeruginosa]
PYRRQRQMCIRDRTVTARWFDSDSVAGTNFSIQMR